MFKTFLSCYAIPLSAFTVSNYYLPWYIDVRKRNITYCNLYAADIKECGGDKRKLARKEAVAKMVLGEDAEIAGGLRHSDNFLEHMDKKACGKMKVSSHYTL